MSVCDTSRHQPAQQRNTVRLAWQRMLALHTLIHNMNYSHNPLGPDAIFISSTSSFNLPLFTSLIIPFFFLLHVLPSLQSFLFSACLLSFSFPPLCSFSVDVWRALQPRGDGDWSYPGQGATVWVEVWGRGEDSLSGGWKDGYVSECWERRASHWWIKDQVGCTWELWFSIAGGETGEPGHALACVLFAARLSQSPLLGCITNKQGVEEEGKRAVLFAEQYLHSVLGLCKVCKSL